VVRQWLSTLDFGGRERWVRMNPLATGYGTTDIEETIAGRPDGYIVPKPRAAADIRAVAQILDRVEYRHGIDNGTTKLLPLATETPEGALRIHEIATASPRIVGISWGIEDLGAAMGLPRTRDAAGRYLDVPRWARVLCTVAASAAGVDAIDTVYTDIANLDRLREECDEAVAMGFVGKISIHPHQVPVINAAFTPPKDQIEDARELVRLFDEHARRGVYAFTFKGQMVDAPHLALARRVLARAAE
jgi:citrate lyase subunit beta/citryl-CoA lyase